MESPLQKVYLKWDTRLTTDFQLHWWLAWNPHNFQSSEDFTGANVVVIVLVCYSYHNKVPQTG